MKLLNCKEVKWRESGECEIRNEEVEETLLIKAKRSCLIFNLCEDGPFYTLSMFHKIEQVYKRCNVNARAVYSVE